MKTFSLQEIEDMGIGTVESCRAWIRNGELKAFSASRKLGSRKPRYRVTEEALQEFIDRRSVGAVATVAALPRRQRETVGSATRRYPE